MTLTVRSSGFVNNGMTAEKEKRVNQGHVTEVGTKQRPPAGRRRCPDKCAGAMIGQRVLTIAEAEQLSDKARLQIVSSQTGAIICEYCGCVYLQSPNFARRLGILNAGWHSELFPR
jgi:hypothetical protein